jgi:hypothetical protein
MSRFFSVFAFASLGLVACSSDGGGNTTTGKRITLRNSVAVNTTVTSLIKTGFGYDVTLKKAAIATNGLYYFDGPPPTAMFGAKSAGERFASLFIGTAYAHPGHYEAGTALGQVALPAPTTIDLFATAPLALPAGDGITGVYRSARFVIPTAGPGDALLGTHVAMVEGKAVKSDGSSQAPIFFRLVADFADVSASIRNGAVDGCVLDETTVTDSGSIALSIAPNVWLNLVEFSKIAPGTEAAPTETKDSGFSQGVTQLSGYHFTYTKP